MTFTIFLKIMGLAILEYVQIIIYTRMTTHYTELDGDLTYM